VFEDAGYTTLAPGWPDDPNTVDEANRHPEVFAHKTVGQIADHFQDVIGKLNAKPAVIGHRSRMARSRRHRPRVRPTLREPATSRANAAGLDRTALGVQSGWSRRFSEGVTTLSAG
jgi:hypothetical protein